MERFTAAESKQDTGAKQNGDEDHSSPLSTGDSSVDAPRPKPKAEQASGDDDAAFAARLQAEENARGRTTRGTASGKRTTPKKAVKKKAKSVSKVKVTDDSDLESTNSGGAKIVNRSGAFHVCTFYAAVLHRLFQISKGNELTAIETLHSVGTSCRAVWRD